MDSRTFTAVDALHALWRRKISVVIVAFVVIVIVGLITIFTPKTYISRAQLLVKLGQENSTLPVTASLGDPLVHALPLTRESEINSIAELIQNKQVYGKVVDKVGAERILKRKSVNKQSKSTEDVGADFIDGLRSTLTKIGVLDDVPQREKAIIKLQKKVNVRTDQKSTVLTISFESHSAELAQEVVSEIVSEYQKLHAKVYRAQGSNQFLTDQTAEAKKLLADSERAFEDFKTRTNMISVEEQRKVLVDRIANLKNQLIDVEASRKSIKTEIDSINKMKETISKSEPIEQREGAGNKGIDGMREELFRVRLEHDRLLNQYGPGNPRVERAKKLLAAAQKNFDEAESNLVESVEGPSKVYEGVMLALIEKKPALEALSSKAEAIQLELDNVIAELHKFNQNETEFIRLKREMEIKDATYKRYHKSLEQAQMDSELQKSNVTNLSIGQEASINPKPFRPSKLINLLAGIFLGTLFGCAWAILLEYKKHNSQNTRTTQEIVDLPVISSIPRQERQTLVEAG